MHEIMNIYLHFFLKWLKTKKFNKPAVFQIISASRFLLKEQRSSLMFANSAAGQPRQQEAGTEGSAMLVQD